MTAKTIDGFTADPAQGLRLRVALSYYGAYPEMQNARGENLLAVYQRLRARRELPQIFVPLQGPGMDKELASLELIFSERIVERLRAGTLEAKGRVKGTLAVAREVIPADFWERVQLSIDDDTATADGVTVTGLLIFETLAETALDKSLVQDAPVMAEFSEKNLAAWFKLREGTWPADQPYPSEAQDLADAIQHFGHITRAVLRQVRSEKTSEKWRKPGPRRGN